MSGYGGDDDAAEIAMQRVEERVALAKSLLPKGPGTMVCICCGEDIPQARRKALPGVVHCVECQEEKDKIRPTFKEPWAT